MPGAIIVNNESVSSKNPMPIRAMSRGNKLVSSAALVFSSADAANTQVVSTIAAPSAPALTHEIRVYNPSSVTNLTMKVFNTSSAIGGGAHDCKIATLAVPKLQALTGTTVEGYSFFVDGFLNGSAGKLTFSNDSTGHTFTAHYEVWEI